MIRTVIYSNNNWLIPSKLLVLKSFSFINVFNPVLKYFKPSLKLNEFKYEIAKLWYKY